MAVREPFNFKSLEELKMKVSLLGAEVHFSDDLSSLAQPLRLKGAMSLTGSPFYPWRGATPPPTANPRRSPSDDTSDMPVAEQVLYGLKPLLYIHEQKHRSSALSDLRKPRGFSAPVERDARRRC